MKKIIYNKKGFTLIEVGIILAILLTIGTIIFRVFYGKEMQEWNDSFWRSIGVDPFWPNTIIGVVIITILFIKHSRDLFEKKRNKKMKLR